MKEGQLYVVWTIEALGLILEELHVALYPSQRKKI